MRTLADSRAASQLAVETAPSAPSPTSLLRERRRKLLRVLAGVALLGLGFHVLHGQTGLGGRDLDDLASAWLYDALVVGSAASCLVRAWAVPTERLPWAVLGVGLMFEASGEIYYSLAFGSSGHPPIPSIADLLHLLYYPAAYAAMVLLVRARLERFNASTWLDGAIAVTTAVAVIAAVWFQPILHTTVEGKALVVATNMAFPVGDVILCAIVLGVCAMAGWRLGRSWALLGIGLALAAVADTAYVYASAQHTYVVGGALDSLWLASAVATGFAAWQPRPRSGPLRPNGTRLLLIPGSFALAALAVLLYAGFHQVAGPAVVFAALAILLVIVRGAWTFTENLRLLETSRRDAFTDALTGLGNRRRMNIELERTLAYGADAPPAVLVMFDLDGFKFYNDQFGHLAGDTLLSHLGHRLTTAVGDTGWAFRQGGDEFCILLRGGYANADARIAAASAALSANGEGFSITCSHGSVAMPREAETPTAALRLADTRMYAEKGDSRRSTCQQTSDVLMGLLRERRPDIHEHVCAVSRVALLVGRQLRMTADELEELNRAAQLHDIGKAAIPDVILNKARRLTEQEWEFVRRHTIIGERILSLAPALGPISILVRSSHERWDGNGYPDRLAGTAIPLGSRVIAVCDAFDAMTRERAHRPARPPLAALTELRREAGAQFDPEVVEALANAWRQQASLAASVMASRMVGPAGSGPAAIAPGGSGGA